MPFSLQLMLALLIGAFIGIFVLSKLIAKQIEKVSSKRIAGFTYLVFSIFSAYYLVDLFLNSELILNNIFFYFWLLLMVCGIMLFWRSWCGYSKHTQKAETEQ